MRTSRHFKKIYLDQDKKQYCFHVEIIKNLGYAEDRFRQKVKDEVKSFFIRHWKDFGDPFFDHALFDSSWVLLVRYDDQLVGTSTLHKIKLIDKIFYNFKTNAVAPQYHSMGLLERMNHILFKYAYIDNLIKQRSLWIHLIFSTPNLRIIGLFAKYSSQIYPNPYKYDIALESVGLPDEETFRYVQAYNKVDFPPNLPLTQEGSVVDDSNSEWPHICYETTGFPYYRDKRVNAFGDHYLKYREGMRRMIVVCAHVTPFDVIRYFLIQLAKLIKRALRTHRA